jgi:hypothetical protein
MEMIKEKKQWEGTATRLLTVLREYVDDESIKGNRSWPRQPNYLSNRLKRLSPSLRLSGIDVNQHTVKGKKMWGFNLRTNQGVGEQQFDKLLN